MQKHCDTIHCLVCVCAWLKCEEVPAFEFTHTTLIWCDCVGESARVEVAGATTAAATPAHYLAQLDMLERKSECASGGTISLIKMCVRRVDEQAWCECMQTICRILKHIDVRINLWRKFSGAMKNNWEKRRWEKNWESTSCQHHHIQHHHIQHNHSHVCLAYVASLSIYLLRRWSDLGKAIICICVWIELEFAKMLADCHDMTVPMLEMIVLAWRS